MKQESKKGGYIEHKSTVNYYCPKKGEPENLEFRIDKESNVFVVSVLFVDRAFLNSMKNFDESSIFINSQEELYLERLMTGKDRDTCIIV